MLYDEGVVGPRGTRGQGERPERRAGEGTAWWCSIVGPIFRPFQTRFGAGIGQPAAPLTELKPRKSVGVSSCPPAPFSILSAPHTHPTFLLSLPPSTRPPVHPSIHCLFPFPAEALRI